VKVESLIFGIIAFFCVAAAVVYGFWAKEPIGTTALVLSAGLTGLIGGFFWFVSRRIDARPEDRRTPRSPTAPASWASSARRATGRSRWPCPPR
jgi:hypothetical protein